jgi:hypothetical protein
MHTLKIVHASHASGIHKFMNTKIKLLKSNVNIYFNRTCLEQNLTPQYAQIKLHSHNKSESKITKIRIKNEIKFLYAKETSIK